MRPNHYHKVNISIYLTNIKQSRGPYLSHANTEVTFMSQSQISKAKSEKYVLGYRI